MPIKDYVLFVLHNLLCLLKMAKYNVCHVLLL